MIAMSLHKYHIPGENIHKYGARRAEVDGIVFASRAEARRWQELCLLRTAGEIKDLQRQKRFPLVVDGEKIATYVCDFIYRDCDGNTIVEDCKGVKTPVYKLKKKLIHALYHIDILETGGRSRTIR